MKTITKYIYDQVAAQQLSHNDALTMIRELQDLPRRGMERDCRHRICR